MLKIICLNKYIGESTGGNDCPVTEAGVQILNGKQALSYARIRKGVGDEYARTDRQREVLIKVAEKLKETKPSKYLGIMNSMLDYIKTNIDPIEALNMAYTIYKFPALEIEQLQIPIPELADGRLYKNLGWVFLMDTEQNAKYLREFVFENKIPDSSTYDYDSFNEAMSDYKAEESDYNDRHNINPEDYEENSVDVTEPPASNNSNQGGSTGGTPTTPPVSDEKKEEVTPPTTPPPTEEQKPETTPSEDIGEQETNPNEVKPAE